MQNILLQDFLIVMDKEKGPHQSQIEEKNNDEDNKSVNSQDSIDYYADDTPLPKAQPFDLKSLWLSNTDDLLKKFDEKLTLIKKEQKGIEDGFQAFSQNQRKYKLSSLRKINIVVDKKKLYDDFMLKTRKTIQKISPSLLMNIFSYAHQHLFYFMTKIRRVSKIFNQIYINQSIQYYLAEKDYLYEGDEAKAIKYSKQMCSKYLSFHKTFLYYKAIHYTEQIPHNSIMKDFENAVNFINQIHKLVYTRQSKDFSYYTLMNNFIKQNRIVIGLSSLSLTSLVMVRKAAIIAFSNYLAFNRSERKKQQITKTKYSKVISVVEYQDYRDTLIINTKVSNYMWENYGLNFAVLVTPNTVPNTLPIKSWNFLIFHLHNQLKTTYLQDVQLDQGNKFLSARIDLQFSEDMSICKFATIEYQSWIKMSSNARKMVTVLSQPKKMYNQEDGLESINNMDELDIEQYFSHCYFYSMEQYYVIAIPQTFA